MVRERVFLIEGHENLSRIELVSRDSYAIHFSKTPVEESKLIQAPNDWNLRALAGMDIGPSAMRDKVTTAMSKIFQPSAMNDLKGSWGLVSWRTI